jgi:hypothetical protein
MGLKGREMPNRSFVRILNFTQILCSSRGSSPFLESQL